MKKTKLTTIVLAIALASVFSITAIAANVPNSNEAIEIGATPGTGIIELPGKVDNLRAKDIGDFSDVIINNIFTRWDALTGEQKAELCDSNGRKLALTKELIDKYLEFGIIDQAAADTMTAMLDWPALREDRVPGSCVPGDFYWNTARNTVKGDGDIVAMP
jgi:hypothetical protein